MTCTHRRRRPSRIGWALALASPGLAAAQDAEPTGAPPALDSLRSPPDQLVLHEPMTSAGGREVLDLFLDRLRALEPEGAGVRQQLRALPPAMERIGTDTLPVPPSLELLRAVESSGAGSAFLLTYQPATGQLLVAGFDGRHGVSAVRATKRVRSIESDELDDDQRERIVELIEAMAGELDGEVRLARAAGEVGAGDPPPDSPPPFGDEDPIELGFRWRYADFGKEKLAEVTQVLGGAAVHEAGLRAGDRVVALAGRPVRSPAHFGRTLAQLAAGGPVEIEVERGEETIRLTGLVERASTAVPRHELGAIGAPLPPFRADLGVERGVAPVAFDPEKRESAATLVLLFDANRSGTWDDFAQLQWLRSRFPPGSLAIAGVAVRSTPEATRELSRQLALSWPAAADPEGRFAEATCTLRLPALLLAGRDGTILCRYTRGAALLRRLPRE